MVNREELVRRFSEEGMILSSHGIERIEEHKLQGKLDEIISAAKERGIWLITDEFLLEFIPGERELEEKKEKVVVERGRDILAREIDSELEIVKESDVTDKSTCKGELEDFIQYFNNKYEGLREILRNREALRMVSSVKSLGDMMGQSAQIIAMVKDKRESSKGYRFLDVEDPTGEITILVPSNNDQLRLMHDSILLDEVIGIRLRKSKDLFIAEDIFQPELPVNHEATRAEEPISIALLSDFHVGSYLFLEKEFNAFLDSLNLKRDDSEIFKSVKYLLVAGDLVDGVGVYPNQDKELSIPDIYKQYDFLASLLEKVPDYIEIVLAMGNHDAVRGAEPQPSLAKDIGGRLYEMPNVHVVGNPVMVSTHGVKTLMYHGTSLDSVIGGLANCNYKNPEVAMVEYLKRRYLVPSYGNDTISPEQRDYLLIREIPDIFHSGHVHTNGYANYRGVKVINSGTFQGKTKYQEGLGHEPTPARVPIINLQSHEVSVVHF